MQQPYVGLEGVAVSEAAYQHAVANARGRVQGKPIGGAERDPIITTLTCAGC